MSLNRHSRSEKIIVTAGMIFFTLFSRSLIWSSELLNTADAFDTGEWQLTLSGQSIEKEPVVDVKEANIIQVPITGGSANLFSKANAEIEMEIQYKTVVAALTIRPKNGLHYRVKVGQVRNFELEFSSGSLVNSLKAESDGVLWGVGLRWNGSPSTLVSAGVALDLSYTQTRVDLDRFQSGTSVSAVDERYVEDEIQGAINVSRRFKTIEPYGGLKISRTISRLKDKKSKQSVRGEKDGVSPFLGISYEPFEKERFVVEVSFVDEKLFSAGWNLKF